MKYCRRLNGGCALPERSPERSGFQSGKFTTILSTSGRRPADPPNISLSHLRSAGDAVSSFRSENGSGNQADARCAGESPSKRHSSQSARANTIDKYSGAVSELRGRVYNIITMSSFFREKVRFLRRGKRSIHS
jgi:hypothetical protein